MKAIMYGWLKRIELLVLAALMASCGGGGGSAPATAPSISNLEFSPEADARTLLRRASLTLTGLPPTPDEMAAWLADTSPAAWGKQVDRLLDSRTYGERMAGDWMAPPHTNTCRQRMVPWLPSAYVTSAASARLPNDTSRPTRQPTTMRAPAATARGR